MESEISWDLLESSKSAFGRSPIDPLSYVARRARTRHPKEFDSLQKALDGKKRELIEDMLSYDNMDPEKKIMFTAREKLHAKIYGIPPNTPTAAKPKLIPDEKDNNPYEIVSPFGKDFDASASSGLTQISLRRTDYHRRYTRKQVKVSDISPNPCAALWVGVVECFVKSKFSEYTCQPELNIYHQCLQLHGTQKERRTERSKVRFHIRRLVRAQKNPDIPPD